MNGLSINVLNNEQKFILDLVEQIDEELLEKQDALKRLIEHEKQEQIKN